MHSFLFYVHLSSTVIDKEQICQCPDRLTKMTEANQNKDLKCFPGFYIPFLFNYEQEIYISLFSFCVKGIIIFKAYQYVPLTANKETHFPWWSEMMAWGCALFPISFIPGWFYYYTCTGGLWKVSENLPNTTIFFFLSFLRILSCIQIKYEL